MTKRIVAATLLSGLVTLGIWCTRAKSAPAAPIAALPDAPPLADAPDNSVPGLTLAFESLSTDASPTAKSDARSARLVALYVPAGSPPTPFLAPGPFKATFEGAIEQKLRGDYNFSFTGNGTVKLTINDKKVIEAKGDFAAAEAQPATLKKGKNKFTVEYQSPPTGDAWVRMYWSADEFPAEPIDPKLYSHNTSAKPIAAGLRVRAGRELFADLRCVKCHLDASLTEAKDGMPELAKDAPKLEDVGGRLNEKWMARWISNPKALRPDTTMPNLLHGKAGTTMQEAADIAAYLAALGAGGGDGGGGADATAKDADAAVAGGKLVSTLGCIGCHTLPDKETSPDLNRITWHNLRAKYKPAALVEFLKQPDKHYSWIGMPNFRLSDDEAVKIAAFLRINSKDLDGDSPKGDPARGEKLFAASGCVSCHGLKQTNELKAPALAEIPKDGWAKGCMARDESSRGRAPDFSLTDAGRESLLAFAATDRSSLKRDTLPELAQRQVTELRCIACHTRDGKLDAWDELAKEVEPLKGDAIDPESNGGGANAGAAGSKVPPGEPQPGTGDQQRPPLTWVGEKLQPDWMATFIAGKVDYKPRVWMLARMPGFPARAEALAKGLALEHGMGLGAETSALPDAEMAKLGKQLAGRNGGFSCIQCHGIGSIPPISPFEAPSTNFKYSKERLRHEFYVRWMRNPLRIIPTTKMPAFAQEGGKTALTDILDGDSNKQFEAIWQYLQAGRKIEHPEQEGASP